MNEALFTGKSAAHGLYDPQTERLDEINERLRLIQYSRGLTFGTDSYFLAAFARAKSGGVCVELGGGSGVVSLLMASRGKYGAIHCAEIQPYFADLIARNARLNSLEDTVLPRLADIRELSPADFGGECDAVVSNPPYMKLSSGKTNLTPEMNAARREENGGIGDFCSCAARLLRHGGYFTVVYRPDRAAELLCAMKNAGVEPKRIVLLYPSSESKPCLMLAEGKKGAAEGVVFSRPLIIYKNGCGGEYSRDMQSVYDNFSLEHLF